MKIAITLLAFAAFAPWGATAASLYGSASAGATEQGTLSQAGIEIDTSPYVQLGAEAAVTTSATGTPSEDVEIEEKAATDADIRAHADALLLKNASVAHAEGTRKGKTVVEYYHPGKLLGFMEVKVKAKTVIEADESGVVSVKTHMPWWNFLVSGTSEKGRAVDGELSATGSVMMDAKLPTAAAKVRLMDAMVAAHARAALMAEATAEAGR